MRAAGITRQTITDVMLANLMYQRRSFSVGTKALVTQPTLYQHHCLRKQGYLTPAALIGTANKSAPRFKSGSRDGIHRATPETFEPDGRQPTGHHMLVLVACSLSFSGRTPF